jgi:hypothetical protein
MINLVPVLAGTLMLFGGCSQGEGDRCQIDSDCASGLICAVSSINGVCRPKGSTGTGGTTGQTSSTSLVDAGTKADAARDAPVEVATAPADASNDSSASPPDAGVNPADTSADRPALVTEAGSDRVSVEVTADAGIEVPADAATNRDSAIDSAMPGNDVASDTDALLTD